VARRKETSAAPFPPENPNISFISPDNLAVDITPEDLTCEARGVRVPPKKTRDLPARLYRRRKYEALREKCVPHSNGTGNDQPLDWSRR
jgi:hypothetical protein